MKIEIFTWGCFVCWYVYGKVKALARYVANLLFSDPGEVQPKVILHCSRFIYTFSKNKFRFETCYVCLIFHAKHTVIVPSILDDQYNILFPI